MTLALISVFAAITGSGLVNLIIQLVIAGLIFWLLWWFVNWVGIPQPFLKVAQVLIALVGLIFVINLLLSLTGNGFIDFD